MTDVHACRPATPCMHADYRAQCHIDLNNHIVSDSCRVKVHMGEPIGIKVYIYYMTRPQRKSFGQLQSCV